ncbi:predicted protein [Plenodomus lingam JN3]|uniref:Predicted protein n=1 Tax=Leptosphaeria maculans (strain JN3 / isolate v23.1.3 / race Av1-4-5-6-7-8) TaxID=985895 RepID=E5AB06_LEPMJ|nr:predicted protein [Plenodomus lingam JN3]CBY00847.1 predicted protein [Plenodomus lingam JN3]
MPRRQGRLVVLPPTESDGQLGSAPVGNADQSKARGWLCRRHDEAARFASTLKILSYKSTIIHFYPLVLLTLLLPSTPAMEVRLSTKTVIKQATITSGPEINNQRFQRWHIHSRDGSMVGISSVRLCPSLTNSPSMMHPFIRKSSADTSDWAAISIYRTVCSTSLSSSTWRKSIHGLNLSATLLTTVTASASSALELASSTAIGAQSPSPSSARFNVGFSPATNTMATSTASPSSTADPIPSRAWIAGVVAGPILGLALVAFFVWQVFRSKRKRQQNTTYKHGYHTGRQRLRPVQYPTEDGSYLWGSIAKRLSPFRITRDQSIHVTAARTLLRKPGHLLITRRTTRITANKRCMKCMPITLLMIHKNFQEMNV